MKKPCPVGQGFLQTTPLQVAVMFAVPANDGYMVTPHLLKDSRTPDDWREPMGLQPETVKVLQEGLRQVISSGTARALNLPNLPPIAGKTRRTPKMEQGEFPAIFNKRIYEDSTLFRVVTRH